MARSPDPWRDDLTQKVENDGCMLCAQPTRSHLLLFVWDDDDGVFRAVTDHAEADAYGHVCHGCFSDNDADHGPVLQQYAMRCQRLCDKYDVDVTELVNNPNRIKGVMDADDWDSL